MENAKKRGGKNISKSRLLHWQLGTFKGLEDPLLRLRDELTAPGQASGRTHGDLVVDGHVHASASHGCFSGGLANQWSTEI